jgi:signal transduction histidine kinase
MAVYTQIDSMNWQNIDVNSVILSECAPFKNNLLTEGGLFDLDLSSEIPEWMISEIGLRRSLQVLLYNAVDAIQGVDKGCIKVSTEIEDKNTLIIRVTDNGCGIRKDKLDKVFELFYTTKGAQYSGIGLATVKKFMESHGGKISVVSQPEVGSVFSMVFPKTAPTD